MDEYELTDIEIRILKQLHDRVNRPASNMAKRLNYSVEEVEKNLQSLRKKGLVEARPKSKWRITFDGEKVLEAQAIERQRFADKVGSYLLSIWKEIFVGVLITIVGGIILAYLIQDARFARPSEPPIIQTPRIPSNAAIFEENFEDEKAQLFEYGNDGDWKLIVEDTGNKIYDIDNTDGILYPDLTFGSPEWTNYATEFRIKILAHQGIASILHFRESVDHNNGYILGLLPDTNEIVIAYKLINTDEWQRLKSTPFNIEQGKWYLVYVSIQGSRIQVYMDNYLLAEVEDTRFRAGRLSLSVGPGTHAQFDDIKVYKLN